MFGEQDSLFSFENSCIRQIAWVPDPLWEVQSVNTECIDAHSNGNEPGLQGRHFFSLNRANPKS